MINIKWFGHSCFKITSNKGIVVVTDPFDPTVGYSPLDIEADIVTSSHSHYDHNYFKAIKGDFKIIDKPKEYNVKDIIINGIRTFHDNVYGTKRGKNIVFLINMDGIKLCHLGDLGHTLTDKQLEEIGKVDVLFIPVGGYYTINNEEAVKVVKQLNPKLTIPMHFKTPEIDFPITDEKNFLKELNGRKISSNNIDVDSDFLETEKVISLNYKQKIL